RLALKAALSLQAAVAKLGPDLACSVGVHSGSATVRNAGSTEAPRYAASGETVATAMRLQAAAPPGVILCSPAAGAAVKELRTTPAGPQTGKGSLGSDDALVVEGLDA